MHSGNQGADMRRARYRVTVAFAVHGAVVGVFATRILWIQERLHFSPTALGAALVAPVVSACSPCRWPAGQPGGSVLAERCGA